MAKGNHCATFRCYMYNDHKFLKNYVIKDHSSFFRRKPHIRFWSCKDLNKLADCTRRLNRLFYLLDKISTMVLIRIAKKILIAIFLPRVLMYQALQISVGYRTMRPKTGDWELLLHHFRTLSFEENRFLSHFLIVS